MTWHCQKLALWPFSECVLGSATLSVSVTQKYVFFILINFCSGNCSGELSISIADNKISKNEEILAKPELDGYVLLLKNYKTVLP
jgi:hypothetical protein